MKKIIIIASMLVMLSGFAQTNPPKSYYLNIYQTPVELQDGRGTCWANTLIAALEAYYKRHYFMDLDLSEQYLFHIIKAGELFNNYMTNPAPRENNSSFWGFQGNVEVVNHMMRFSIPLERDAPFLTNAQMVALRDSIPEAGVLDLNANQAQVDAFEWNPGHVPMAARLNALYRVQKWTAVPAGDRKTLTTRLEKVISSKKEVAGNFQLRWRRDELNGKYYYDATVNQGSHAMLIIGYNRDKKSFWLKDSNNPAFIEVDYKFVQNCYASGITIDIASSPGTSHKDIKAAWLGNWNMGTDGWQGRLLIRRFTNFRVSDPDKATKLGNYFFRGNSYDVNGFFTHGGRCMTFYVASTTDRVQPGSLVGRKNEVCLFSWNRVKAGGYNQNKYGVILTRDPISYQMGQGFDYGKWLGTWNMEHDGWKGTLTVTGFKLLTNHALFVEATYKNSKGEFKKVTGTIDLSMKRQMKLKIWFSPYSYTSMELYYHTWTKNVFTGLVTGSKRYGVIGYRK